VCNARQLSQGTWVVLAVLGLSLNNVRSFSIIVALARMALVKLQYSSYQ